jgi:hypothetical protein
LAFYDCWQIARTSEVVVVVLASDGAKAKKKAHATLHIGVKSILEVHSYIRAFKDIFMNIRDKNTTKIGKNSLWKDKGSKRKPNQILIKIYVWDYLNNIIL